MKKNNFSLDNLLIWVYNKDNSFDSGVNIARGNLGTATVSLRYSNRSGLMAKF